jgi:diguanylate cyclase (GGDEF)-like protein
MLEKLRALAAVSLVEAPTQASVLDACAIITEALDAEGAYVLRSGDPYFIKLGSDADPREYDIKQRGYWLVWQQLARDPILTAGIATVRERIVTAAQPMAPGATGNYIGMILPGEESNSEMLVIHRGTEAPATNEEILFIETARAVLSRLVDRVLDTERRDRQRRQLSALADVARAFNSAHGMEAALNDLATAIASASGYDFVTVLIYDEALEKVVEQGNNVARHANTETASMMRGDPQRAHREFQLYGPLPRRMRKGIPYVVPDVFEPGVLPDALQRYYQRAHVNSFAWLPLMFQDTVLGTVDFTSSVRRDFSEDELSFLRALADQAATAVKGMVLYRDLERSRQEVMNYAEQLESASRAEHFLARTDSVTGIPNRRYLEEVLRAEAARSSRYREPLSVVMADLDHFKSINDRFGHPVGDEALRFVSSVARSCSRASDFVGRWGGDEFLFVLPHTKADDALAFAERFRTELSSRAFRIAGEETVLIPVSAGVTDACPPPGVEPDVLIARADIALYEAKESGRDRVCHWVGASAA